MGRDLGIGGCWGGWVDMGVGTGGYIYSFI